MITKVTISFTMTFSEEEKAETLAAWKEEYVPGAITNCTLNGWAEELAAIIQQQWDGFGEGKIYSSEMSVNVQEY